MKQTRTQIASTPVADPWWDVHSSKFLLAALVDFHPEAVRPVTESRTPYVTELRKESQERMIMTLCSSSSFDTGLVTICVHTYQMLCANWLDSEPVHDEECGVPSIISLQIKNVQSPTILAWS